MKRPRIAAFAVVAVWAAFLLCARASAVASDVAFTVTASTPFFATVTTSQAGCILVQINGWSAAQRNDASASKLALALASGGKTLARVEGSASASLPLWTSVRASSRGAWSVELSNTTKAGSAAGVMTIDRPANTLPCEFRAVAARNRGQIDLSWSYAGATNGTFLVERSVNGGSWRALSGCVARVSQATFRCSDSGLSSGATVLYRACVVRSGSMCSATNRTPNLSVRAP